MRAFIIVAMILTFTPQALADPITAPTRIGTVAQCMSAGGSAFELPPESTVRPPDVERTLDARLKRLELAEVRLGAENKSLRRSIRKAHTRWYWIAGAFTLGWVAQRSWSAVR